MSFPRLLDPEALDEKSSPRGRASIVVPTNWLREGARLEVDLPTRLRCDLCDGGGCDTCGRSGAYKLPEPRSPVVLTLPRVTDDLLAVWVTNPLGECEPALLVVRVAAGNEPSAGVRYVGPSHDFEPAARHAGAMPQLPEIPRWVQTAAMLVGAAALAVLARLFLG